MHKRLVMIVLVLCFSPLAWSTMDQQQLLKLGAVNSLLLTGDGLLTGASTNIINGNTIQHTTAANGQVVGLQAQDGVLFQVVAGGGNGSSIGVDQSGLGNLAQAQTQPGGLTLGDQNQAANVGLDTQSAVVGGDASLYTLQGFVGNQVQMMLTPYSMSMNIQPVSVIDSGFIRRMPGGVGSGSSN